MSSVLGLSTALTPLINGCATFDDSSYDGKVLVIGAGAAGMSAGYLLNQRGIDFEILEAKSGYGGRFQVDKSFTDFPISLGAEWLHKPPSTLDDILNDRSVEHEIELRPYSANTDTYGTYIDGEYSEEPLPDYGDSKFIGSSWFDFYERYIVPSIRDKMTFNTPITRVDYSGDQVVLTDNQGGRHTADKVIITVPLRILQLGWVNFVPALPQDKQDAIEEAFIWSGIKIFIEFSEKFFPEFLEFSDSETQAGQRAFYSVSVGQNSSSHILGVFAVGAQAERYINQSDRARLSDVLNELDEIFAGAASRSYIKHLVQNWNDEPYAHGAYLEDDAPFWISSSMATSVDDKLYFAGTSYTSFPDWSSVHTAARSAREAVDEITG